MKLLNKNLILSTVLAVSVGMLLSIVTADSRNETKSAVLSIDAPAQEQGFFAATYNSVADNTTVTSSVLNTEFPFNAVAFKWVETQEVDFDIFVRFEKEQWSEWIEVEEEVDFKDDTKEENISRLITTDYTNILQYKLVFKNAADKEYVTGLDIEYIDSTKGASTQYQMAAVNNSLNIISRAEWGADESYGFDKAGQEKWPEEYYKPKRFILHHTASTKVTDPAATVRAIYYWHAQSKDWGDIGYNYLVDSYGNIYEGRRGGDGVVGGHAYMNNRNTIGIAVLGCYDSHGGTCSTAEQLTPATKAALEKLIAVKSQKFDIDPESGSRFDDHGHLPHVVGHTDVNSTYCPGDQIYNQLSFIRTESKVQLAALQKPQEGTTDAQFVSISARNISIPEGQTKKVYVQYKNTGDVTWRSYEDYGLILGTHVKKLGSITGVRMAAHTTNEVEGARLVEGNVHPGETGTFVLDLPAKDAQYTYTLAWQGQGYYPDTDVDIKTKKVATASTTTTPPPVVKKTYLSLLEQSTLPERIPAETSVDASVKFYNMGNATWEQDALRLEVTLENGSASPLLQSTTYTASQNVDPNSSVTFNMQFSADHTQAAYIHAVTLKHGSKVISTFNHVAHVISPYSGVVVSHSFPVAVKNTWRPTVEMTVRNVGSQTWHYPTLKSTDVDGTLSWFFDWSWKGRKVVQTKWTTVKPGEEVTFNFKLNPYWKPNTYPHVYKLWSGDQAITLNGQEVLERWTRVDQ